MRILRNDPNWKQLTQEEAVLVQLGLIARALGVVLEKRRDYSGDDDPYANLRRSQVYGINEVAGVLNRMGDKEQRIVRHATEGLLGENIFYNDYPDILNYTAIAAGLAVETDEGALLELCEDGKRVIQVIKELTDNLGVKLDGIDESSSI